MAKLAEIATLAERHGAMVLVDDCHATGHLGEKGRGTPALTGAGDRIDIVTGTFGKTLGGGMGGFVAAAQPIVDLLRRRAGPYLFSNSLSPPVAAGRAEGARNCDCRGRPPGAASLQHTKRFRAGLEAVGFKTLPGRDPDHPGDARRGQARAGSGPARSMRAEFIVAGFFFPVVPKGQARIRTQMSAALTAARTSISRSNAFADAGRELGMV